MFVCDLVPTFFKSFFLLLFHSIFYLTILILPFLNNLFFFCFWLEPSSFFLIFLTHFWLEYLLCCFRFSCLRFLCFLQLLRPLRPQFRKVGQFLDLLVCWVLVVLFSHFSQHCIAWILLAMSFVLFEFHDSGSLCVWIFWFFLEMERNITWKGHWKWGKKRRLFGPCAISFHFQKESKYSNSERDKVMKLKQHKRHHKQYSGNAMLRKIKKEQPILNKRSNREIGQPCETEGGGGWAAEENKETEVILQQWTDSGSTSDSALLVHFLPGPTQLASNYFPIRFQLSNSYHLAATYQDTSFNWFLDGNNAGSNTVTTWTTTLSSMPIFWAKVHF